MENIVKLNGKLYTQELEFVKDNQGRNLVRGSIGILVDEKTQQVERVNVYTYEMTKAGKKNNVFVLLQQVVNNANNFYENNKNGALSVSATCNLYVDSFYVEAGNDFELRQLRRLRLVFLNEDAISPMGANFSFDCNIVNIADRVDDNGVPTNEADLQVEYYDEYRGTMSFKLRVDNPDYLAIIKSKFIPGSEMPYLMNLGGKIVDVVTQRETPKETAFGVNAITVSSNKVKTYVVESGDFLVAPDNFEALRTKCKQIREEKLAEAKTRAIQKKEEKSKPKATSTGFGSDLASDSFSKFHF